MIYERNSWPVLYHFSHIRQNILEWLPITKEQKVLEIGSGCGPITGVLARKAKSVTCIDLSKMRSTINAYRNRECDNVKIMVGNFQDVESSLTEKYDYITLIGVFEYSRAISGQHSLMWKCSDALPAHLALGGRIVIAIENRLGLKYWAAAPKIMWEIFEGLENYSGYQKW